MLCAILPLAALLLPPPQEPTSVPPSPRAQESSPPGNHLVGETSPYLLEHSHNPVDWYPWGKEALERAKKEDKPIFLSIGYSACHWCHVMERESFEDEEIAAYMNAHFVSIKVDREERPDLDELYMAAVQRMTGSGGWPMSVFLTPDLKPFYGGTYFPPREKYGRPGFLQLLQAIAKAWKERREDIEKSASEMGRSLAVSFPPAPQDPLPAGSELSMLERRWVAAFDEDYDSRFGGFGGAPKFPQAADLRFLLALADRHGDDHAREMAYFTLQRMASGGMYDQIGGGFARYSTDAQWLIPHFEKMLYDQGTLIPVYLEAWRQSGDPFYARIARECCDYLLREMRDPGGAFWSSTDADSEGVEGKFFLWTPDQLRKVLGKEDGDFAVQLYGISEGGNFENGESVLVRAMGAVAAAERAGLPAAEAEERAERVRAALYTARSERVHPHTDDKILVSWNGLAIGALARAGRMLGEDRYTEAATEAADFLERELHGENGWLRAWRAGRAQNPAVLADLAFLCRARLELFQSTGDENWLHGAEDLAAEMLKDFRDPKSGIFWDTDGNDPTVLHRRATPWDGMIPSANAVALQCLTSLHVLDHEDRWGDPAHDGFAAVLRMARGNPRAFSASLRALLDYVQEPRLAVVIGNGSTASLEPWRQALYAPGRPHLVTVFRPEASPESASPVLADRIAQGGRATLYLCEGTSCLPPSTDPSALAELLSQ